MTTLVETDQATARFAAWLPDDLGLHIAVKREDEQWFALLLEFDITGCGATPGDAVAQSFELLMPYLQAYFEEGVDFEDALRPVPRALRSRIVIESMIGRALRRAMIHLPLTDESTYALPPGLLPRFATG